MEFFNIISEKYNISLNDQQKDVVSHLDGPSLVLAGPGSGKTTVIVSRTAFLIMEAGIKPENILTVTFNRAAGKEMGRRFEGTFGKFINGKAHFSTIHSFCNMVIKHYERMRGKTLKRIDGNDGIEDSKRKILKKIYYEVNSASINDDELENLLSELSLVKNTMMKDLEGSKFNTKNFEQIYKVYEKYKKTNLMIDFDDMLTYTYSIFTRFPHILDDYRKRYKYIQVDEGQDLSSIQFEIIKCLAAPYNNVFIVADDDQSIYGFRGAEPEQILGIEKNFPGCRIYNLECNYRSTGNIVDISSSFIKSNSRRFNKNHKAVNQHAKDPVVIQPKDENSQLKFLVDMVKKKAGSKEKTIGILYRNNLSSISIVEALDKNGVKFALRQNKLFFFSHWAVLDILAFLKFAMDQRDVDSFLRICFRMNRFISKAMIEHGLNQSMGESFVDCLLTSYDLKPFQINRIQGVKEEFRRLARMQTSTAISYIENDFKYFESIREYCEATGASFDYVYGLFGVLKTLAASYPSIPVFLHRLEQLEHLMTKTDVYSNESRITLTTIHSAKGLEYNYVIMADLIEEEIPGRKAVEAMIKNKDSVLIEEERRLFYVGITRAREELFLICPQYVNSRQAPKSIFVSELTGIMNRSKVSGIAEGSLIHHKHFGKGIVATILDSSDERITIEIDFSGIRRKLDFTTCMESGLITLLND